MSSLRDLAIYEAPIIDHVPNECMLAGWEIRRHLWTACKAAACVICGTFHNLQSTPAPTTTRIDSQCINIVHYWLCTMGCQLKSTIAPSLAFCCSLFVVHKRLHLMEQLRQFKALFSILSLLLFPFIACKEFKYRASAETFQV